MVGVTTNPANAGYGTQAVPDASPWLPRGGIVIWKIIALVTVLGLVVCPLIAWRRRVRERQLKDGD